MADVTIIDTDGGKEKARLKSKKKPTVKQLLKAIGEGTLVDSDSALMLKHEILEKGKYYWTKEASGKKSFSIWFVRLLLDLFNLSSLTINLQLCVLINFTVDIID